MVLVTHPHDSVSLRSICTFESRRPLQATNLFATPPLSTPPLSSCSQPQCQFVLSFSFDISDDQVECRLCFQTFAKRESLSPYQPLPLCCLTAHSFSCRSSYIGVAHTSLDGSSLFTVSSSPMCASSQKRDAEILLSHCPSGSADFLEFLNEQSL